MRQCLQIDSVLKTLFRLTTSFTGSALPKKPMSKALCDIWLIISHLVPIFYYHIPPTKCLFFCYIFRRGCLELRSDRRALLSIPPEILNACCRKNHRIGNRHNAQGFSIEKEFSPCSFWHFKCAEWIVFVVMPCSYGYFRSVGWVVSAIIPCSFGYFRCA